MEEAFKSYIEECNKTKALLLEWCDGRLKVERELLELAHQFEEWEMEEIRTAIGSPAATGSDAAEGSSAGAQSPTVFVKKIRKRRGSRFQRPGRKGPSLVFSLNGTNVERYDFRLPCSDSLRSRINDTVGLLEQDKISTDNLIKTIEALKEEEALFLDNIVDFDVNRDFLLPSGTNVVSLIDVVRCLIVNEQNFSHPDFLSDMLGLLMDLKSSLHLAEVVRNITNLAVEGSRCRCRVAFQLRSIAEAAKWECCYLHHLMTDYLPLP